MKVTILDQLRNPIFDKIKLLQQSDVISLHVPKSLGVVLEAKDFPHLKPQVIIVNSSGYENKFSEK